MSDSILWYATRGAGAVSLVLLSGVVALGVASALRWRLGAWPRFLTAGFHRNLALLSVVFLALHIVTAVVDPYTSLGWAAAVVPFSSPYRTFWLGLGVVALDLLGALIVTSLLRSALRFRTWRLVHWFAYACWPLALVHGLGTGTDATRSWMLAIEVACLALVLAAVVARLVARQPASSSAGPRSAAPPPSPAAPGWSGLSGASFDPGAEAARW